MQARESLKEADILYYREKIGNKVVFAKLYHALMYCLFALFDIRNIGSLTHADIDGSGYPRGLRGEDIPLGARFFMVVDVYDALTSECPYHTPVGHDEAVKVITQEIGSHFDPATAEAFL